MRTQARILPAFIAVVCLACPPVLALRQPEPAESGAEESIKAGLEEAKVLYGFPGPVRRVAFTRDPQVFSLFAAATGNMIATVDWKFEGRRKDIPTGEEVLAVTFSSTQHAALAVTASKAVRSNVFYPEFGFRQECQFSYQIPPAERLLPGSIVFSPDRRWALVTGKELSEARLQNLAPEDKQIHQEYNGIGTTMRPKQGKPVCAAFHPDGKIAALGTSAGTVEVWRLPAVLPGESKLLVEFPDHGGQVQALLFSPDGKVLASGDSAGFVRTWRWDDAKAALLPERQFETSTKQVYAVSFVPVWTKGQQEDPQLSSRVLAASGEDGLVWFWDLSRAPLELLDAVPLPERAPVLSISFSPDGEKLAAGRQNKTIVIMKTPGGVIKPLREASEEKAKRARDARMQEAVPPTPPADATEKPDGQEGLEEGRWVELEEFRARFGDVRIPDGAERVLLVPANADSRVTLHAQDALREAVERAAGEARRAGRLPDRLRVAVEAVPAERSGLQAPGVVIKLRSAALPYEQDLLPVVEVDSLDALPEFLSILGLAFRGPAAAVQPVIGFMTLEDAAGNVYHAFFV